MMEPERDLAHSLEVLRSDISGFLETRVQMLREEMSSAAAKAKAAGVGFGVAAAFGLVGLFLLGICTALAISLAFASFAGQVALIWGFLASGIGSLVIAAIAGWRAAAKLKAEELTPRRTLRVLARDKEAIQKGVQEHGDEPPLRRRA